jgi:asparagine synthase (glutamine-hydrolysing)
MCGIAGYYGKGSRDILEKMGASLTHRGPDAGGELIRGSVGLAHRRLSILDLSSSGAQPMSNKTSLLHIVFNGEIFNFAELKDHYLSDVVFFGTSDTEVILELFEKFGTDAFPLLQGMFAFSLYDERSGELFLVRDSLGKKPLYYSEIENTLLFGSELKALRQHPDFIPDIDKIAIAQYLVYEYIPAPRTIYTAAQKLMPGSYITFKDGKSKITTFAEKQIFPRSETGDDKKDLDTLLASAIEQRLVADVPVGVFLSGGLDSSTIAYYAQKNHSKPIKTFSIGFTEASFDESDSAKLVAQHFGTEHYSKVVGIDELKQVVIDLPDILDEPMADSSIIPTVMLSAFAREHVTVVLSGDGADELFSGYDIFYAHELARLFTFVPNPLIKFAYNIAKKIPVSHKYMSFDFKLKRFLSGVSSIASQRNTIWLSAFTPNEVSSVLCYSITDQEIIEPLNEWQKGATSTQQQTEQEYKKGFLCEDILVKVDRATMKYGLEARVPFLDERIVQFASTLAYSKKRQGKVGKKLLRELMEPRLPKEIQKKAKQGFNIPIGKWFMEDWGYEAQKVILEGKLAKSGLFNHTELAILLAQHRDGTHDHRKKLWSIYVLARWFDKWYV